MDSGLVKWKKHTYFSPLMMFACFLALFLLWLGRC